MLKRVLIKQSKQCPKEYDLLFFLKILSNFSISKCKGLDLGF